MNNRNRAVAARGCRVLAPGLAGLLAGLLSLGELQAASLWPTSALPSVVSAEDASAVELGVKFRSAMDGYITAIRFYKGTNNLGAHVGRLWTREGSLLGTATFIGETSSGWQEQALSAPVAIVSNTTYVASYLAPQGRYSFDGGYFAIQGVTNYPLQALADGQDGGNGVFRYGEGAFPDISYASANYWVDVVFQEALEPDTSAPVVLSVSPAAGQTNVVLDTVVVVTLSEPVDAASLTTNTFVLRDATNGLVPATVSTGAVANVARLAPVSSLSAGASYTATIEGGAGGVLDLAGNPLASSFSWSFSTAEPDTAPPTVVSVSPGPGAQAVAVRTRLTVQFSESMDAPTLNTNTFTLRDASNQLVAASIEYDTLSARATLIPAVSLFTDTLYTAAMIGGGSGVKDLAGNALATNYTWSFATMPDNPYGAGPGGPILVLTDGTNSFNAYYAEIMLTEGLNAFALKNVSSLSSASDLIGFDVVLVGDLELSAAQVGILSNWVVGGGNLVAMRPDKKLAGLLGLADAAATLSEGYLLVNTTASPGTGIVGETMQYHGTADLYTLAGATASATLYSNATGVTVWPAVTVRSVGTNGGNAAAFTYDLARSVVLTRQGNPAWADQDRDGSVVPTADDLFYGNSSFDPQPDWVDFSKVAIPQADEQQRLLVNLILGLNMDRGPLPRFWYFPNGHKAVVVMTGDNHGNNATDGRFDQYLAYSPTNGSLEDWELVRGTSYIYSNTLMSSSTAAAYTAQGFEVALHLNTGCAGYTRESLEAFFSSQLAGFESAFPSLPSPQTLRNHCIAWSGYTLLPEVAVQYGVRFETSYYYWPPAWVANRPGLFTGSAMPMRFVTADGNVIDAYQAVTQMTDESGQAYPYTVDTLLDRALGGQGYYGAYVANMHTDFNPHLQSDAIVTSCQARGVPVVTALQMLGWLDARNSSSLTNIAWSGSILSFQVNADGQARGLETMVPLPLGRQVNAVRSNGVSMAYRTEAIKGLSYAILPVSSSVYEVEFDVDTNAPVVVGVSPTNGAVGVSLGTVVAVTFSEAMDVGLQSSNVCGDADAGRPAGSGSDLHGDGQGRWVRGQGCGGQWADQ